MGLSLNLRVREFARCSLPWRVFRVRFRYDWQVDARAARSGQFVVIVSCLSFLIRFDRTMKFTYQQRYWTSSSELSKRAWKTKWDEKAREASRAHSRPRGSSYTLEKNPPFSWKWNSREREREREREFRCKICPFSCFERSMLCLTEFLWNRIE